MNATPADHDQANLGQTTTIIEGLNIRRPRHIRRGRCAQASTIFATSTHWQSLTYIVVIVPNSGIQITASVIRVSFLFTHRFLTITLITRRSQGRS
jgi:hypothetical protein